MILRTIPARFEFVARMLRHESRPRRELAECENPGRQSEEGSQRGTESRRKRQQTTPALAPQRIARRPKKNKKGAKRTLLPSRKTQARVSSRHRPAHHRTTPEPHPPRDAPPAPS